MINKELNQLKANDLSRNGNNAESTTSPDYISINQGLFSKGYGIVHSVNLNENSVFDRLVDRPQKVSQGQHPKVNHPEGFLKIFFRKQAAIKEWNEKIAPTAKAFIEGDRKTLQDILTKRVKSMNCRGSDNDIVQSMIDKAFSLANDNSSNITVQDAYLFGCIIIATDLGIESFRELATSEEGRKMLEDKFHYQTSRRPAMKITKSFAVENAFKLDPTKKILDTIQVFYFEVDTENDLIKKLKELGLPEHKLPGSEGEPYFVPVFTKTGHLDPLYMIWGLLGKHPGSKGELIHPGVIPNKSGYEHDGLKETERGALTHDTDHLVLSLLRANAERLLFTPFYDYMMEAESYEEFTIAIHILFRILHEGTILRRNSKILVEKTPIEAAKLVYKDLNFEALYLIEDLDSYIDGGILTKEECAKINKEWTSTPDINKLKLTIPILKEAENKAFDLFIEGYRAWNEKKEAKLKEELPELEGEEE